uniref:Uncharacterized protein n=1 Tax=viral metagenome TaxID=1070528 RepID=A0A6C0B9E4_9ZZZZ
MINPCNSIQQYIQFNPKYNLPTHYGNRYQNDYIQPTDEMKIKHKMLILKHSNVTNGPGVFRSNNGEIQLPLNLQNDVVIYFKNIIYKLPCRFKKYVVIIKTMLEQGNTIKQIITYLINTYNISEDLTLNDTIYQNKRVYTYPYSNIVSPKQDKNIINSSAPYKTGNLVLNINLQHIINDLPIPDLRIFFTPQYATDIFVSNNDNRTFTNNFNDLLPNGSASFFGSFLLTNYNELKFWRLRIFIVPHYPSVFGTYGFLVDASKYFPNKGLIFMPIHTYVSLLMYKPYPKNMPFTINVLNKSIINEFTIPCRLKHYLSVLE